jgi:hypothetical protein
MTISMTLTVRFFYSSEPFSIPSIAFTDSSLGASM